MINTVLIDDTLNKNMTKFQTELKMHINQRLFEKKIITEDMYASCKEQLLKRVCAQHAFFVNTDIFYNGDDGMDWLNNL